MNKVNNSKHRILLLQVIGELETLYSMIFLLWRRTSQNLKTQSLQIFLHVQLSPTETRILPATNNQETEGRCACDFYNEKFFPWTSFKAQHRSTATRETARENPRTYKMLAHSFTCPKHIKRHTVGTTSFRSRLPHPLKKKTSFIPSRSQKSLGFDETSISRQRKPLTITKNRGTEEKEPQIKTLPRPSAFLTLLPCAHPQEQCLSNGTTTPNIKSTDMY